MKCNKSCNSFELKMEMLRKLHNKNNGIGGLPVYHCYGIKDRFAARSRFLPSNQFCR